MIVASFLADRFVLAAVLSARGQEQAARSPALFSPLSSETAANNPQSPAADHSARAARQMAPQRTTLPDPKLTLQQFSVGRPKPLTNADVEAAAIEGAVQRLRLKLMTVCAVLASLVPIRWESGIGSDVMKPIAAPIVGGMITSTIHVLILMPFFFIMMNERTLRTGNLRSQNQNTNRTRTIQQTIH